MTEADFPAFEALVSRLRFLFRSRATTEEFTVLCSSYFKALQGYTLAEVNAGADACIESGKFFPRVHEWRRHIPRRDVVTETLPAATDAELWSYRDAAAHHWEDIPCLCKFCVRAGVSDLPRRYVPAIGGDDRECRLRDPQTGKTIYRGHWLHGEELALWYLAREQFTGALRARVAAAAVR